MGFVNKKIIEVVFRFFGDIRLPPYLPPFTLRDSSSVDIIVMFWVSFSLNVDYLVTGFLELRAVKGVTCHAWI